MVVLTEGLFGYNLINCNPYLVKKKKKNPAIHMYREGLPPQALFVYVGIGQEQRGIIPGLYKFVNGLCGQES